MKALARPITQLGRRRIQVQLQQRAPIFSKIMSLFGRGHASSQPEADASREMADAVRELSRGRSTGVVDVPGADEKRQSAAILDSWDKRPPAGLSLQQMAELARAHADGHFGGDGERRPPDLARAAELWRAMLQAEQGHVEASYGLANCLRTGRGADKDAAAAFTTLRALADEQDFGLAHYAVALMYLSGEGQTKANGTKARNNKKQNRTKRGAGAGAAGGEAAEKAYAHFKKAALRGVKPALYNLGNCLAGGTGVGQDEQAAARYYSAAAEAGDPMGKFTLGTWLVQGRGGLAADTKRAFELQCEAGQAGFPGAMFNAGCHLMSGQGCEVDEHLAAQWFQRAADVSNLPQACINLGNMYKEGCGVPQDLAKARNLYARNSMTHQASRQALHALEAQMRSSGGSNAGGTAQPEVQA